MTEQIKGVITNRKSSGEADTISVPGIPAEWHGRRVIVSLDPDDPVARRDEIFDQLIDELDAIAVRVGRFEFGLPSRSIGRYDLYVAIDEWLGKNGYSRQRKEGDDANV